MFIGFGTHPFCTQEAMGERGNRRSIRVPASSNGGRRFPLLEGSVPYSVFKGRGNDTIPCIGCMNIVEEATHPRIRTNVWIGHTRSTKGGEDVNEQTVAADVVRDVLVNELDVGHCIGTDILVGVVIVHYDEVSCYLSVDSKRSAQFRQNGLRQVRIDGGEVAAKTGTDRAGFGIDIGQQIVRANVQGDRTDTAPVQLQVDQRGVQLRADIRELA